MHDGSDSSRQDTAARISGARIIGESPRPIATRTLGRISDILNGKRSISPETALRLARYLGTSATFWVNLQARYDLAVADRALGAKIAAEVPKAAA